MYNFVHTANSLPESPRKRGLGSQASLSPLSTPGISSAGDSLGINSFHWFTSKEYPLTFIASPAVLKLRITPEQSFSRPESGLHFSSREKPHVDRVLAKKSGAFSCKFIS